MQKVMRICTICETEYAMGYGGTDDGCDSCLGIIRDDDGYFYLPDEDFITLVSLVDGTTQKRNRPIKQE